MEGQGGNSFCQYPHTRVNCKNGHSRALIDGFAAGRRAKEEGIDVLPEGVLRTGSGLKQAGQDRYFHVGDHTSLKLGIKKAPQLRCHYGF